MMMPFLSVFSSSTLCMDLCSLPGDVFRLVLTRLDDASLFSLSSTQIWSDVPRDQCLGHVAVCVEEMCARLDSEMCEDQRMCQSPKQSFSHLNRLRQCALLYQLMLSNNIEVTQLSNNRHTEPTSSSDDGAFVYGERAMELVDRFPHLITLVAALAGDAHPIERRLSHLRGNSRSLAMSQVLHAACIEGHLQLVQTLTHPPFHAELGDYDELPFRTASKHGHHQMTQFLLQTRPLLETSLFHNEALRHACQYGHVNVVRQLLSMSRDRKVDPTSEDNVAFTMGCKYGHASVVRQLLSLDRSDGAGDSPLRKEPCALDEAFTMACEHGHLGVVRLLLQQLPPRQVGCMTMRCGLQGACRNGHYTVVRELLSLGANGRIDLGLEEECDRDTFLRSVFELACGNGHVQTVKRLLHPLLDSIVVDSSVVKTLSSAFGGACAGGHVMLAKKMLRCWLPQNNKMKGKGKGKKVKSKTVQSKKGVQGAKQSTPSTATSTATTAAAAKEPTQSTSPPSSRPFTNGDDDDSLDRMMGVTASKVKELGGLTVNQHTICDACERGHLAVVRMLLSIPAPNRVDPTVEVNYTIRKSACNGHKSVFMELMSLTGDRLMYPTAKLDECFRMACANGHASIVRVLLSLEDDRAVDPTAMDDEAFRKACGNGHVEIVRMLLDDGRFIEPSTDDSEAFRLACENGHSEVVELLLQLDGERAIDPTALEFECFRSACLRGHVDVVRTLLKLDGSRRVDVNVDEGCALSYCASEGHFELAKLLLQLSGSQSLSTDETDFDFCLYEACRNGHLDLTRLLLSGNQRGDPSVFPCLEESLRNGHLHILRELMELREPPSPESAKAMGEAIKTAIHDGYVSCVKDALERDCIDFEFSDDEDAAADGGHVYIVRALKRRHELK